MDNRVINKVVDAAEAVAHIRDGAFVAVHGSGGGLCEPTALLRALRERYLAHAAPRGITIYESSSIGDRNGGGMDLLAVDGSDGLIACCISGHWAQMPGMGAMALANKFQAYNYPQGVLSQMYAAIAAGGPGVLTKIGLNTFVDPRVEGGMMNAAATTPLVKVVAFEGEEYLFYPRHNIDVCFVRGTTADTLGNVSCEEEAAILDGIAIAQATRNCGGIVVAQVKYLADHGAIRAKDVRIPGHLVDYVVVDAEQRQTAETFYSPSLAGNIHCPQSTLPPLAQGPRRIVAARAARELVPGAVVNLGYGMPDGVASIAREAGLIDRLTFSLEQGLIGGMPASGVIFGCAYNPEAIIDSIHQFNFYDGGGLDIAFLGVAQADGHGNVNSSKTGGLLAGCGGFINISQNAKKVVFCTTFTAKGLKLAIGGGRLRIEREGEVRKFVRDVEQITFSARNARANGQEVLLVSERAVFRLAAEGWELVEVAPGIDVEREILGQMDFRPLVSPNLKEMDAEFFQ